MSRSSKLTPPKFDMPLFATRIYDRRPEWKFHKGSGQAKNAFGVMGFGRYEGELSKYSGYEIATQYARPGELWRFEDGRWELEFFCDKEDNAVKMDELPWRKQ